MPRATNSTVITFGLVSIPCKIYTAQSAEGVKFNQLTPAGNRISQKTFDKVTGDEVARGDLVKGYEYAKDQYVTFTKDELKSLEATDTSKTVSILEFVPADTVDHLFVEKSYYLGPDKGASKGYALLAQAMLTKGVVAVAQWTNRGKEHVVCIRALKQGGMHTLVFQQMFYANEVRPCDEIGVSGVDASEVEVDMAGKLIDMLAKPEFKSDQFTDTYAERVKEAVEQKVAGEEITVAPAVNKPNVIDLAEALKASLEADAKVAVQA